MEDFPIKGKDKFWPDKSYFIGENESQKNRQFKKNNCEASTNKGSPSGPSPHARVHWKTDETTGSHPITPPTRIPERNGKSQVLKMVKHDYITKQGLRYPPREPG